MVKYERICLPNGLACIYNEDCSTPFVAVNILYKVGAKNETEGHTGFAHLFEHLMFGGSENIPDYDARIQAAGGENNAFTTNDYTNYYIILPASNLEAALWLESDRMAKLVLSEKALRIQKDVVVEEFKQRYLNTPYGDIWLKLRPLAYKRHPYRRPTIGCSVEEIRNASLSDVKEFYRRYYAPDNAILSISGNIKAEKAHRLVEKWFGDIPAAGHKKETLPAEPEQKEERRLLTHGKDLPADAIYKAFHTDKRISDEFYICNLISDLLSDGNSSRFYNRLIKGKASFSSIDAYVTGDTDPGLFIVSGKISPGISPEEAEKDMENELHALVSGNIPEKEIRKVINKTESKIACSSASYRNKASELAFFEMLGNAALINGEYEKYENISSEDIVRTGCKLFEPENSSTLIYLKS